ncbi:hypothetical protein G6034_00455 [Arthrobacter sp. AETb3-4]|uniref:Uncharacterized protein n=1 Tax=Arthrobacter wenxiniae TaxID=2713570 RepID=A0A7Y7IDD3_9MICC|nr:hypothetical protein [Arthrobacter wenxiniae]
MISRGRVQSHQGGYIYRQAGVGAHAVHGAMGSKRVQMDDERSALDYPGSGESCSGVARGCVQPFLGGSIVRMSGAGVSAGPNSRSVGVAVTQAPAQFARQPSAAGRPPDRLAADAAGGRQPAGRVARRGRRLRRGCRSCQHLPSPGAAPRPAHRVRHGPPPQGRSTDVDGTLATSLIRTGAGFDGHRRQPEVDRQQQRRQSHQKQVRPQLDQRYRPRSQRDTVFAAPEGTGRHRAGEYLRRIKRHRGARQQDGARGNGARRRQRIPPVNSGPDDCHGGTGKQPKQGQGHGGNGGQLKPGVTDG